ncbi:MAG: F0F1 ATP synthase subunit B [Candidatus Pacebacteria bacterium]|jgi:F-type H+-transporting ATPase subunit b|nr:F0F1 ATP synthase subunit B [Candidatus Paceibacterota bacterium]
MEALIETFHIDIKLMIAQIINFILVFLAIYLLAAKPLRKTIEDRTKEIEEGLHNSKKNREILENTKKEYDSIVLSARKEAEGILKTTREDAENKKREMLEVANKEVATLIENGKKSLEQEREIIMKSVKKEIVDLVIATSEKVLGEQVDNKYKDKVVKELGNL